MGDGKYGEDKRVTICVIRWPSEADSIRRLLHRHGWILNHTEIEAARFQSIADAKKFAEATRIALNDHTYINQEDFTDGELHGQAPFE